GMKAQELREKWRDGSAHRSSNANDQLPGVAGSIDREARFRRAQLRECRHRGWKELLAIGRKAEVARIATQERNTQLVLERRDHMRHRRRAHAQLARCCGEAAGIRHAAQNLHSTTST